MLLNYWVKSSLVFKPTAPLATVPTIADFTAQPEAVLFLATNCIGKVTTPTGDSFDVLTGLTIRNEIVYAVCCNLENLSTMDLTYLNDLKSSFRVLTIDEVKKSLDTRWRVYESAKNYAKLLQNNLIDFAQLYFHGFNVPSIPSIIQQNFNCHLYKVAINATLQEFEGNTHALCLIGKHSLIAIFPETFVAAHSQLSLMPVVVTELTVKIDNHA